MKSTKPISPQALAIVKIAYDVEDILTLAGQVITLYNAHITKKTSNHIASSDFKTLSKLATALRTLLKQLYHRLMERILTYGNIIPAEYPHFQPNNKNLKNCGTL